MADNTTLDAGTGGDTIATDDIGGVKHQRVKVQHGADGAATDTSAAAPLPVQTYGHDGADPQLLATDASGVAQVDVLTIAAGDNNIGNVDVASSALPTGASTAAKQDTAQTALDAIKTAVEIIDNVVSGSEAQVDVVSLPATPAGTNLIGRASASNETSTIYSATSALTPKFAAIDAATSGDNTLVAAVADKKIRVVSCFLVAAGTVTARFESGAGGTALTGQVSLVANTGFVLPYNPVGWFEAGVNTLLNLELSGAVSVDGSLTYIEV